MCDGNTSTQGEDPAHPSARHDHGFAATSDGFIWVYGGYGIAQNPVNGQPELGLLADLYVVTHFPCLIYPHMHPFLSSLHHTRSNGSGLIVSSTDGNSIVIRVYGHL
jgi:hypothetical protein